MESMIRVRATFDYPKLPAGRTVRILALLRVEADSPRGETRRPLNIGVVLDRSGSMQGAKIHNVREATKALAEKLGGEDTFSLTIFDNVIETIIPPRKMGEGLAALVTAVDGISARGSTNLCGGYQAGCESVLGRRGNGALDRVVLLTDGLANVGVTDPAEIASVSGGMAEKGIVTSTIGVGTDYSELLLGRMAEAGGGNTYYLQGAMEVEEVLEEELGGLLSLAAENLRVRFEPATEGVKAGQLNAYRTAADGTWVLGDVYGSQSKILVLELQIPPTPLGKKVRCGTLHLTCKVTSEGGTKEFTQSLPLELDVVSGEDFAALSVDAEVTLRAAELIYAAARARAWELAGSGDFVGAAKALNEAANGLEGIGLRLPEIAKHIEDLRMEARRLESERDEYYTPSMRKSMYAEARLMSHGKYSHLENMRSRHSGRGSGGMPGGCHTFSLYEASGRLIAQLEGGRYLVDTGWPDSVSDRSPILVGSRSFDVKSGAGVPDAVSISRDIRAGVSGILGADILRQFDVWFDVRACRLALDENRRALPGRVVNADFSSGLPVLQARIGGADVRLVLSTGCRISFLRSDLAAGGEPAGRSVENLAGVGEVEIEIRKVSVQLGSLSYALLVGTLPPALERMLAGTGAAGVLGANPFASRALGMSARQGIVTIESAGDRQS